MSRPAAFPSPPATPVSLPLDIVIVGLSITSSWGNGHATTFRSLVSALAARGHRIRFFERDVPWYAQHRDMPYPPWCTTVLYDSVEALQAHFPDGIDADLVILGSYVPEATRIAPWLQRETRGLVTFYDIDTPVTVAALGRGACAYLQPAHIPAFDCYWSFAGGPVMQTLHEQYGAPLVRPLYCSVDPQRYRPAPAHRPRVALGYLGTYSDDRQPTLERLLFDVARRRPDERFAVAGAQYPPGVTWPTNVSHEEHCPPSAHAAFYTDQRFTLNVTRRDMVKNGWSPSIRLFEAAACGVPIITDWWEGLNDFFEPDYEILVAGNTTDVLCALELDDDDRRALADRARRRVLGAHTASHRAREVEQLVHDVRVARSPSTHDRVAPRTSVSLSQALSSLGDGRLAGGQATQWKMPW